jgi:hypothetical protein
MASNREYKGLTQTICQILERGRKGLSLPEKSVPGIIRLPKKLALNPMISSVSAEREINEGNFGSVQGVSRRFRIHSLTRYTILFS